MEGGAGEKKKERSAIRNSQFAIRNPQFAIRNPLSLSANSMRGDVRSFQ